MEEMTDKELLQKNVEEFSRLQSYMKLCEKDRPFPYEATPTPRKSTRSSTSTYPHDFGS